MDTPFILAPLGMVMILPTEFNITLLVISLNPKLFIISVTSGYSFTKSYTDLDKSNFFSILIPSCQKYCLLLMCVALYTYHCVYKAIYTVKGLSNITYDTMINDID